MKSGSMTWQGLLGITAISEDALARSGTIITDGIYCEGFPEE